MSATSFEKQKMMLLLHVDIYNLLVVYTISSFINQLWIIHLIYSTTFLLCYLIESENSKIKWQHRSRLPLFCLTMTLTLC